MGGTARVLTIRGIPINVHVSWLVIYGLITWILAVDQMGCCGRFGSGQSTWKNFPRGASTRS